jgi:hypothetical protein
VSNVISRQEQRLLKDYKSVPHLLDLRVTAIILVTSGTRHMTAESLERVRIPDRCETKAHWNVFVDILDILLMREGAKTKYLSSSLHSYVLSRDASGISEQHIFPPTERTAIRHLTAFSLSTRTGSRHVNQTGWGLTAIRLIENRYHQACERFAHDRSACLSWGKVDLQHCVHSQQRCTRTSRRFPPPYALRCSVF